MRVRAARCGKVWPDARKSSFAASAIFRIEVTAIVPQKENYENCACAIAVAEQP